MMNNKNKEVSLASYINFLKWLSMMGMIMIYFKQVFLRDTNTVKLIIRCLFFGIITDDKQLEFPLAVIEGFIDKDEDQFRVLMIFICSTLHLFLSRIIEMEHEIKNFLEEKPKIERHSYFVQYFSRHLFNIIEKKVADLVDYKRDFKFKYMEKLNEQ